MPDKTAATPTRTAEAVARLREAYVEALQNDEIEVAGEVLDHFRPRIGPQ